MSRFCFFSAQYLPHMGGVERYTANLARVLCARGHRVTVVTSSLKGSPAREQTPDGVQVVRLPSLSLINGRLPVLLPWGKPKNFPGEPFDLAVVNTRLYSLSLFGVKWAHRAGTPCIVIDHSTGHIHFDRPWLNAIWEWYEHAITKQILRCPVHFYGVSQEVNRWLAHFNILADGVLYNAVDPVALDAAAVRGRNFRTMYRISRQLPVVVYVGRLVAEKGVLRLIEAINRLPVETRLLIAGEGPLSDTVIRAQNDRVCYLGKLAFEDVASLLQSADIYCLPTVYPEGFPTATLEAMASGCFCVVTDKGGARELIPDDRYGHLLSDGQSEEIGSALLQAIDHAHERTEAAMRGKQRVRGQFTFDKTADNLEQLAERAGKGDNI